MTKDEIDAEMNVIEDCLNAGDILELCRRLRKLKPLHAAAVAVSLHVRLNAQQGRHAAKFFRETLVEKAAFFTGG